MKYARQTKWPADVVERARTLHDRGAGPTEIARLLGVPRNTVRWWLSYRGRR